MKIQVLEYDTLKVDNANEKRGNSIHSINTNSQRNVFQPEEYECNFQKIKCHPQVRKVFNSINNMYDKSQLQEGILKLKGLQRRVELIDLIIKRQQEIDHKQEISAIKKQGEIIKKVQNKLQKNNSERNINTKFPFERQQKIEMTSIENLNSRKNSSKVDQQQLNQYFHKFYFHSNRIPVTPSKQLYKATSQPQLLVPSKGNDSDICSTSKLLSPRSKEVLNFQPRSESVKPKTKPVNYLFVKCKLYDKIYGNQSRNYDQEQRSSFKEYRTPTKKINFIKRNEEQQSSILQNSQLISYIIKCEQRRLNLQSNGKFFRNSFQTHFIDQEFDQKSAQSSTLQAHQARGHSSQLQIAKQQNQLPKFNFIQDLKNEIQSENKKSRQPTPNIQHHYYL